MNEIFIALIQCLLFGSYLYLVYSMYEMKLKQNTLIKKIDTLMATVIEIKNR